MAKYQYGIRTAALSGLALLVMTSSIAQAEHYTVEIDVTETEAKELSHYWKSTGWSTSDLYRTPDFQAALNYLSSTRGGFDYVRPHYMLDLIEVTRDAKGKAVFDFTHFDAAIDQTVRNNIRLNFEWMGNPGGLYSSFRTDEEIAAWREFVRMLTWRLVDRYGEKEIRGWMFETSNEPDIHPFWMHGVDEFLNYFDATRAGMRDVLPDLNLGGPAHGRFVSSIFKSWIEHLSANHRDDPPAFISAHTKAQPYEQARYEEWIVDYIQEKHPHFIDVPLVNNEADPIGGWGIPYWWRAGPWHAAFVAQQIDVHNRKLIDQHPIKYKLLGNDHGFMGSWGQRTLFARFFPGDNASWQKGSGDTGGWKPFGQTFDNDPRPLQERFFLVKKPVLTVKSMLSMLGNERFDIHGFPALTRSVETYQTDNKNIGCIATRRADSVMAVLCFNRPQMQLDTGLKETSEPSEAQAKAWEEQNGSVTFTLNGLEGSYDRLVEIRLDSENGNPYALWQEMGSPDDLSDAQFNRLVANQEPVITRSREIKVTGASFSQKVELPSSSVSLILLMPDGQTEPRAVKDLGTFSYTGETGTPVAVVQWAPPADDALLTYEVQYRASAIGAFATVAKGLIGNDFTHVPEDGMGEYRVRSVTFDGRTSDWSSITFNKGK